MKYICITVIQLLFLFFIASPASPTPLCAQTMKPMINPYADHKILHYGFTIGTHFQDLIFSHAQPIDGQQEWYAEIPSIQPGFQVGLIGDLALTEFLNLRLTPTLYFGSKQIWIREYNSGETVRQDIKSNYLSIPLLLKFSSKRFNNLRPYLLAGVSLNTDLSRKRNEPLLLKPLWIGLELGVGSNFYFPYFKLCPELKFCLGFTNVLESNRTDLTDPSMIKYTHALQRVTSRLIVLNFNFE
ncbi:MAG: porin family protein [Bacteroidales bacterium]